MIFVFSTGLIGLVLGLLNRRRFWIRTCAAGAALAGGLALLFYIFGINILGPLTGILADLLPVFLILFSLAYTAGWAALIRLMQKRLRKLTDDE